MKNSQVQNYTEKRGTLNFRSDGMIGQRLKTMIAGVFGERFKFSSKGGHSTK